MVAISSSKGAEFHIVVCTACADLIQKVVAVSAIEDASEFAAGIHLWCPAKISNGIGVCPLLAVIVVWGLGLPAQGILCHRSIAALAL